MRCSECLTSSAVTLSLANLFRRLETKRSYRARSFCIWLGDCAVLEGLVFFTTAESFRACLQLRTAVKYLQYSNGKITLATNCDMFVFMNGELVVDLGGVHGPQAATLNLGTVRLLLHVVVARMAGVSCQFSSAQCMMPHAAANSCAATACDAASSRRPRGPLA
jgi:fibro-slime domain-containing protein